MKVAVLDYAVGNLFSISNALRRLGAEPTVTSDPRLLEEADAVVLPGVGSFPAAAARIAPVAGLLRRLAREKPVLGVCLGMQLFFQSSLEGGRETPGLSLLPGRVVPLPPRVKGPHMGWNTVHPVAPSRLLEGVPGDSYFYFVHSYYADTAGGHVVATTRYGVEFPSVVETPPLYGTQFHPEKSGRLGLKVLGNFLGEAKR